MSHTNLHTKLHRSSHTQLRLIEHTIQRNSVYHYKRRVDSTFVQFSLSTSCYETAKFLVALIDKEISIMKEHEIEKNNDKKKSLSKNVKQRVFKKSKSVQTKSLYEAALEIENKATAKDGTVFETGCDDKDYELVKKYNRELDEDNFDKDIIAISLKAAIRHYLSRKKVNNKLTNDTIKNKQRYLDQYRDYIEVSYVHQIDRLKHRRFVDFLLHSTDLSRNTIINRIAEVNSFFDFVYDEYDVRVAKIENVSSDISDSYAVFTTSEIDIVVECLKKLKNDHQRLIVILCFLLGTRVKEIGQLYTSDVRYVDDVMYLSLMSDLTEENSDSRSVKNKQSRRCVPVPSCLVNIISKLKSDAEEKKQTDLFFKIKDTKKGRGEVASAAFRHQLKQYSLDKKVSTYSARTSFTSFVLNDLELTKDSMIKERTKKIQGHMNDDVSLNVYFKAEMLTLRNIIDTVYTKHYTKLLDSLKDKY